MDFTRATTVHEALAAKSTDADAEFLAGGTDLMVEVNLAHHRPNSVIGIGNVAELAATTANRIGATIQKASSGVS